MAAKPKKSSSKAPKSAAKSKAATSKADKVVAKKTVGKETKSTKTVNATVSGGPKKVFAGFFACKHDPNETILTIFKSPRIWGAVLGELIGTMLITMVLLTLGTQPLYIIFACIGVTIAVVALSGAHLNPLVTAGMMATRRVSAIRGVMYILAQVVGAWAGLMIINAFRLGSGTEYELPAMDELTGDTFWAVAFIELLGAICIAFIFARALRYQKKQTLAFALAVTSGVTMAVIFGIIIGQSFFEYGTTNVFNPAISLMYQILPTSADSFGELMGSIGLALAAYVLVPVIGGIAGFYLSDVSDRLADTVDEPEA